MLWQWWQLLLFDIDVAIAVLFATCGERVTVLKLPIIIVYIRGSFTTFLPMCVCVLCMNGCMRIAISIFKSKKKNQCFFSVIYGWKSLKIY